MNDQIEYVNELYQDNIFCPCDIQYSSPDIIFKYQIPNEMESIEYSKKKEEIQESSKCKCSQKTVLLNNSTKKVQLSKLQSLTLFVIWLLQ